MKSQDTGALRGQYLIPKLQKDIEFWPVHILHHVLSEYLSKSRNFKNLFFVTSSLYCDVLQVTCWELKNELAHIVT